MQKKKRGIVAIVRDDVIALPGAGIIVMSRWRFHSIYNQQLGTPGGWDDRGTSHIRTEIAFREGLGD
jgi:hypothetical protein